ncbi:laccase 1 [Salpingoeca rosetta]|uniref:Laccase 1 n=1 Tax=Salpingoeca rosetta (strain ATCC 50818 / BSB-021) TaxID=946362 RepID=F2UC68_SALR5|nr:laccase 1 [Salpingoeca rosetta]EGD74175.1 laccase 1 [Salpingoeca rosetta]|eukprot:XP_004993075.1 laccase 1 [Salpingoeca rosetta]
MRWCVASFGVLLLVVVAGTQLRHAVAAVVEYDLVAQYAFVETEHHPIYASSINGTVPGPELRVKRGDRLVVHLHNKFATEGVSIHWHGLEVRDAINMDGVVGLTQCAVPPGESMTYEFVITDEAGTYWYHTHAGIDRVASRGLIGAFIILPADDEVDPHAPLYDEDITLPFGDLFEEATYALFLQNSGSKLPSSSHAPDGTSVGTFRWWTGHVAGQPNRRFVLDVEQGKRYRLRLLNIGELYAFSVCVDNHNLTVIAADGSNTEPYEAECVQLHVAERFDVILEANQPVDNYWLRFKLTEDPAQFSNELLGVVRYTGAPADASPTTTTSPRLQQKTVNCFDAGATPEQAPDTCIPVTALNPLLSRPAMEKPTAFSHEAEFIFVPPPSFGHFTHVRDFSHGIDNPMTQTAISSKPLLQFGTEGDHVHPHINAMYFDYNQTILMYMSHHKDSTRFTHPMHLHGHKFHVVGVGYPRKNGCRWTTCEKLPMPSPESLLHPSEAPLKDTVVMPAGGWVAIAFKADNPGMWLAHCHIPLHRDDGMLWTMLEAVDRIPERNLSFAGFPSCNNTAIAHTATACDCYEDRDAVLGQTPRSDWKCSAHSLCRHVSPPLQGKADQSGQVRFGTRRNETPHWIALVIILALCFGFIFLCRWLSKRRLATPANANTAASATHGHGSGHGTGLREDAEIIAGSHATSLAEPPAVSLRWKDLRVVSAKGSKPLLRGVSGVAQPGCITGVVGASGSGKTVLLRTLAGHSVGIVWEAGEIVVGDVPVQALREENKAAVLSFLPTVAPIRGDLSVEDNINYCGALLLTNATEDDNLTKSFILALAANVFHALGLLLGAAIPDPAAAVAVVTVVVQAMLMMAGFYRTLPDAIQWLPSVIGIPYYILTALMRTEFSANDSYRCHPSRASSAVGPHDCYIETNLLTEDYRQRNILFVQSPEAHDPSEWALVLPLVLFYIGIRILGAIILLLRIRRKFRLHAQQKLPSDHRRSSTHASSGAAPVRREPETKALISCTHSNGTATENGHCTKQRPSHHQRRASQKQLLLEDEANGDAMDGFSGPHTDVSTV